MVITLTKAMREILLGIILCSYFQEKRHGFCSQQDVFDYPMDLGSLESVGKAGSVAL